MCRAAASESAAGPSTCAAHPRSAFLEGTSSMTPDGPIPRRMACTVSGTNLKAMRCAATAAWPRRRCKRRSTPHIEDGIRGAVSLATWTRFEGMIEMPAAFYALIAPYRIFVADDGTPAGGELSFRVVDIQVAGPHERNDPRGIALRTNIPIPADGVSAVRGVFGANDGFLTQWFSIENSELRRRSPHFGGSLPSQSDAAMEVSVTSVSQLWIGRTPDNGFVFQHLTDNFYPYRILVGRWRAIPVR